MEPDVELIPFDIDEFLKPKTPILKPDPEKALIPSAKILSTPKIQFPKKMLNPLAPSSLYPFTCPYCPKLFSKMYLAGQHTRVEHINDVNFKQQFYKNLYCPQEIELAKSRNLHETSVDRVTDFLDTFELTPTDHNQNFLKSTNLLDLTFPHYSCKLCKFEFIKHPKLDKNSFINHLRLHEMQTTFKDHYTLIQGTWHLTKVKPSAISKITKASTVINSSNKYPPNYCKICQLYFKNLNHTNTHYTKYHMTEKLNLNKKKYNEHMTEYTNLIVDRKYKKVRTSTRRKIRMKLMHIMKKYKKIEAVSNEISELETETEAAEPESEAQVSQKVSEVSSSKSSPKIRKRGKYPTFYHLSKLDKLQVQSCMSEYYWRDEYKLASNKTVKYYCKLCGCKSAVVGIITSHVTKHFVS